MRVSTTDAFVVYFERFYLFTVHVPVNFNALKPPKAFESMCHGGVPTSV